MDRGAWWAAVYRVTKSRTRQRLSVQAQGHAFMFPLFLLLEETDSKIYYKDKYWPKSILSMFFPRIFVILGLTFKSSVHFEFIFVHGLRKLSKLDFFFFLSGPVQLTEHPLLKRLPFPHCIFLPPLS